MLLTSLVTVEKITSDFERLSPISSSRIVVLRFIMIKRHKLSRSSQYSRSSLTALAIPGFKQTDGRYLLTLLVLFTE